MVRFQKILKVGKQDFGWIEFRGVEGVTDDSKVLVPRNRKMRVFIHRDEEKICRRSRLSEGSPCNMFVDVQEGV